MASTHRIAVVIGSGLDYEILDLAEVGLPGATPPC
jgi:hypothetical protein